MIFFYFLSFLTGALLTLILLRFLKRNLKESSKDRREVPVNHVTHQLSLTGDATSDLWFELWKVSSRKFKSIGDCFLAIFEIAGPILNLDRICFCETDKDGKIKYISGWSIDGNKESPSTHIPLFIIDKLMAGNRAIISEKTINDFSDLQEKEKLFLIKQLKDSNIVELCVDPLKVSEKLVGVIMFQNCGADPDGFDGWSDNRWELHDDIVNIVSMDVEKYEIDLIKKDMEVALIRSEAKYRMIFENMHDTYFRTDSSGVITMISPSCFSLLGYNAAEIIGNSFLDFFASKENRSKFLKQIGTQGFAFEFEAQMIQKDESVIWISTNANIVDYDQTDDEFESDSGYEGILRGVSSRKTLEAQLIRSERMAAVGTLAGGVAHEFNNINLAILGYAELGLLKETLPKDIKNYFSTIRRSALRAKNITSNLLTFSAERTSNFGPGDLVAVVEDTLIILAHEVSSTGISISKELTSVPLTTMDTAQIGQVVLNILINAHHAMIDQDEKSIILTTGSDKKWVWLSIKDSGCGIPQQQLVRIFSPFFSTKGEHARGDIAQAKVKGTGLGLSISHTIVSNHNGKIEVDSTEGEGTTFLIKLPIEQVTVVNNKATPIEKRQNNISASILILDDEPDLRILLKTFFDSLGYKVWSTGDGVEALEIIKKEKIDLVLLDLQMPKMTGTAFMEELAALAIENSPILVVMTGKLLTLDKKDYGPLNVFSVIIKPFKLNEINRQVAQALQSHLNLIEQ
jgi:PAS domain S-box-containing protein